MHLTEKSMFDAEHDVIRLPLEFNKPTSILFNVNSGTFDVLSWFIPTQCF